MAGAEDVLAQHIHAISDIIPRLVNPQECVAGASSMIQFDVYRMARLLKAGILLENESAEFR